MRGMHRNRLRIDLVVVILKAPNHEGTQFHRQRFAPRAGAITIGAEGVCHSDESVFMPCSKDALCNGAQQGACDESRAPAGVIDARASQSGAAVAQDSWAQDQR